MSGAAREPSLPGERRAAAILLRGGVLAAGVVLAVVLAAAALLPVGLWRPVVALPLVLVGSAVAVRVAGAVPLTGVSGRDVPAWTAWASALVAVGHGVWAATTHAEHVVLRRDAGSYALYAHWISTHHGLPVDARLDAFGGAAALADPSFTLASPAFYEVVHGTGAAASAVVVPQFLPGGPALWSLGYWAAGWTGLLVVPAIVSAAGVLAVAGLTARLAGARAAPLAALATALCAPVLHAARSPYSEPVALLLVAASASLLVDATRAGDDDRRLARRLGLAAGLGFGLAGFVRVDAVREVVLLLPVAAILAVRGHVAARPLVVGALTGVGAAAAWGVLFARPYLASVAGSLLPLAVGGAVLGAACIAVVRAARHGWSPRVPGWAPRATAVLVVTVGLLLAARPVWLVVRQSPNDPGARVVAGLQRGQGLTVDGGRTYAENTVTWVAWWTGPVVLVLALATMAVLAERAMRSLTPGSAEQRQCPGPGVPAWLGPAFVGLASTFLTLYRPGITPDHPWADRRLVPVVLPTVVIAAVAAVAWAVGLARRRLPATLLVAVAAVGVAAVTVPALLATAPFAGQRTERGEPAAVAALCRALGPKDVVLAVDARGANEWPQVVRGPCGRPSAVISTRTEPLATSVPRIAARVVAAGYRPVLLAAGDDAGLTALGLTPSHVVHLGTIEDQRLLTRRPDGAQRLLVDVWLAAWPPP